MPLQSTEGPAPVSRRGRTQRERPAGRRRRPRWRCLRQAAQWPAALRRRSCAAEVCGTV